MAAASQERVDLDAHDEHGDHEDLDDRSFGYHVGMGIAIGLPIAFVGTAIAIWVFTDNGPIRSLYTAILPSILIGFFAGGFTGVIRALREIGD